MSTSLQACINGSATYPQVVKILVDEGSVQPVIRQRWADGFFNESGIRVEFTPISITTYADQLLYEVRSNVPSLSHDGWIMLPGAVPELTDLGAVLDLSSYIEQDERLDWPRIPSFFKDFWAVFDGKLLAMPIDGGGYLMYYRKDILDAHNLTAPSTWEEFVMLARRFNGTDTDLDGKPNFSICMRLRYGCPSTSMVTAMASSMIQYQGPSQGTFIDPPTMRPLLDTAAMVQAMQWTAELGTYVDPNRSCMGEVLAFAEGQCMLSVGWAGHFKAAQLAPMSKVRDKVGVAALPGSSRVLDRETGALVPCTPQLCPMAVNRTLYDGTAALVNFADYRAGGCMAASISNLTSTAKQNATYRFFSYISSPAVSMQTVLDPLSWYAPYRYDQLQLTNWTASGYSQEGAASYLAASKASVDSPNIVMDLRITEGQRICFILSGVADQVLKRGLQNVSALLAAAQQTVKDLLAINLTRNTDVYQRSIGWKSQRQVHRTGKRNKSRSASSRAVMIAVPTAVCGTALILAGLATLVWFTRDTRLTLTGKVAAPGASADTTLVVTDIQDSTALWECFSSTTMEAALALHHATVRQLLVKHSEYESATEGDSFILAFHSAKDAVLFSLELQQALLAAAWPEELLSHPACQSIAVNNLGLKEARESHDDYGMQHRSGRFAAVEELARTLSVDVPTEPDTAAAAAAAADTYSSMLMSRQQVLPSKSNPEADTVTLFRGLRVRIGMHTGIPDAAAVVFNTHIHRTQYAGDALVNAKAVCDAAQGGMVLLSGSTYRALRLQDLCTHAVLLHCGSHDLTGVLGACDMYQVVLERLMLRLPHLGPVRSLRALDVGALDAPAGVVSISFIYIVGVQTLLAWNSAVARESIVLLQRLACQELVTHSGYMVEQTDDLLLSSFRSAEAAALVALRVLKLAKELPWPPELLEHPLGEELSLMGIQGAPAQAAAGASTSEPVPQVILRGLRLKAGIATGAVSASPHATTGRLAYRGRVMNRAARIAATAATGQVLGSDSSQRAAQHSTKVTATPVGDHRLKGLSGTMALYQFTFAAPPDSLEPGPAHAEGWIIGARDASHRRSRDQVL